MAKSQEIFRSAIDRIDRRILRSLQRDSRASIADLAAEVALSPSACHRRVKLLEERGVISGYAATLDRLRSATRWSSSSRCR